MSGGHVHALHVHGHSPIHRLPSHVKVAALLLFVTAVVATPRQAIWAFGGYAGLLAVTVALAEVPPRFVAKRMIIEVPFLLFAVFLPVLGSEPRIELLGMSLSREGTWAAWSILAKGSLGVAASILLAATTELTEILAGLERLKVPAVIVAIAGFMIRYLEVIAGELARMRIAMAARGYEPTVFWQARALATSAGALFIRSYERGERVYQAMVSRGYNGRMPVMDRVATAPRLWAAGLSVPLFAWAMAVTALVLS